MLLLERAAAIYDAITMSSWGVGTTNRLVLLLQSTDKLDGLK